MSEGETTYESYYGFSEKPFSVTPDSRYLYRSESHANAIELLAEGLRIAIPHHHAQRGQGASLDLDSAS